MDYVKFFRGRNGICANYDGEEGLKIAFPDRRGIQPKEGELWEVLSSSMNPKQTVYFLRLGKKWETSTFEMIGRGALIGEARLGGGFTVGNIDLLEGLPPGSFFSGNQIDSISDSNLWGKFVPSVSPSPLDMNIYSSNEKEGYCDIKLICKRSSPDEEEITFFPSGRKVVKYQIEAVKLEILSYDRERTENHRNVILNLPISYGSNAGDDVGPFANCYMSENNPD